MEEIGETVKPRQALDTEQAKSVEDTQLNTIRAGTNPLAPVNPSPGKNFLSSLKNVLSLFKRSKQENVEEVDKDKNLFPQN